MHARLLLCLALLFSVLRATAQDDSPYARFGYEGKVLRTPQERQQRMMLLVPNTDTASAIAKVGLDPANQRYYLFDKQNQVLKTDTLTSTEVARFMSVDPLAPKYPWYTPYQFAGNTPIWATDLDGLEPYYGSQATSGYDLFDNNRDGKVSKGERQGGNQALAFYGLAALDAYVFRGWLTKSYLAYTLGNAIDDGEKSLGARRAGNDQAAAAYSNQSKEAYTQFAIGVGMIGVGNLGLAAAKRVVLWRSAVLGEAGSNLAAIIRQNGLPPSSGAFLDGTRLSESAMRGLSDEFGVEFAQVYTAGTGKNGGGGYYTLYSGTPNSVSIPTGSNTFLINHTHPGGTAAPSTFDIDYLTGQKTLYGSPQNSSVILPKGKPAVRFDKTTPTSN
jgi:hypothetical protein